MGRPGDRPLSTPVVLLAGGALLGAFTALLRMWHGSWTRLAAAVLAPALFVPGLLALWVLERRRGRPLLSRLGTILLLAVLGAIAGAVATAMTSIDGPPWGGAITGLFFGTLIGVGFSRPSPRPAPEPSTTPE
jgi:peptidoglycan/LPS O-acetylase OafA/YrhL